MFTSSISAVRKKIGHYGRSKLMAEEIIINSGIGYTIFRPTMVYGNGSIGLKRIIKNINRFPFFIPLIGHGRNLIQPVYVKDMARLIADSISNKEAINKVFNVGGGEKIEFREFVSMVAKKMNKDNKIFIQIPLFICKTFAVLFEHTMKEPFFTREHIRSIGENTTPDIKPLVASFKFKPIYLQTGLDVTMKEIIISSHK